eukprot:TRINITY_DN6829_c0_g1_i3.p1 TRINITY_DN6829_c0_g1~~TRINITY_DN6829_c0_g1_i3.p1  ORF type:complete len:951 (+),score=151.03 TRINITY_DN6829_c0_g1_i3:300-3152(+)
MSPVYIAALLALLLVANPLAAITCSKSGDASCPSSPRDPNRTGGVHLLQLTRSESKAGTVSRRRDDFEFVGDGCCRGATEDDNSPRYYTQVTASSLEECKAECLREVSCTEGVEFHPPSRCELWQHPITTFLPKPDFQCFRRSTGTNPNAVTTTTTTAAAAHEVYLTAVRNCHLEPLVEGAGCSLLKVHENDTDFGLNEYGQETSGRMECLQRLRAQPEGDVFVHSVGRCEIWQCQTKSRLRRSSGPGGGISAKPNSVSFRSWKGTYLTASMDGNMNGLGEAFDAGAVFELIRNGDGTIALVAQNGKYVKAEPGGHLSATADELEDWEKFRIVNSTSNDGKVGLKSFHGLFVAVEANGLPLANRPQIDLWEEFVMLNRSGSTPQQASRSHEPALATNGRAAVFSNLCDYQEGRGGLHGKRVRSPVFVKLWEWNFPDIARECEEYLAPNGFDAVQVSPVIEHVKGWQWWTKYQPVSQGLASRSGSEEDFRAMVSRCRAVGVEVIVDLLMNHIASPCKEAKGNLSAGTPCTGWGGSKYGLRQVKGARGWDKATPEMFHHNRSELSESICSVGPWTGWLCPDDDCTPCDMYGMPDWNTELANVREMHAHHLRELFSIGVTMLRLDAAIYHKVGDLAAILNVVPWDLVYQEWWGEYPPQERTDYVGHYRDVNYRWQVVNIMGNKNASDFQEILQLNGGVFGITQEMAVYPFAYHDGRSKKADPKIATYKNGLEFHQQQKFFLAWPFGIAMLTWSGYGWTHMDQGPPGCDKSDGDLCHAEPVWDASDKMSCLPTPTKSPMPKKDSKRRGWVCEHRWEGVAGMVHFRKACRGLKLAETWKNDSSVPVKEGHVAFRLGDEDSDEHCFVALVKGYNRKSKSPWGHLGDWQLKGLAVGMPEGRYCDMSSLSDRRGWTRRSCPREVVVGSDGVVISGFVPEGDILAIHSSGMLLHDGQSV